MNMNAINGTVDLDGKHCRYHVGAKSIAVRIDDTMCVTHSQWMTVEQAHAVVYALQAVLGEDLL